MTPVEGVLGIGVVKTPPKKPSTNEELACENHFLVNTKREHDGRCTIKILLCHDASELGQSRDIAEKRYNQVEWRLKRD